ncbi:MAG: hypothetical protein CMG49_01235 [Candidatus Marinimicrobia bacterium]|nr:hypothetical protein [Candidatus Neomarinimicrobiota bacterium]
MKKYIVLTILFVLPLVAYLFFASGVNNFAKLPVLKDNITSTSTYSEIEMEEKISIIYFLGSNINDRQGDALNLNQKIYKRFYQFDDFQFVAICPIGSENLANVLKNKLESGTNTNMEKWNFIFLEPDSIIDIFISLSTDVNLDYNYGSPYVYIIDKKLSQRGRNDDNGIKFGYDSRSVADINNFMVDDVKIILAEYRLALKKNGITRKDL